MKKRVMLVGPAQSGKSALANCLNGADRPLRKTQDVIYGRHTIDTPGSYIEKASRYKYLIATAQTASCVLLLADQSRPAAVYPPGFAQSFNCPVFGVITKSDLSPEKKAACVRHLQAGGVEGPYFYISCRDGAGVAELKARLALN